MNCAMCSSISSGNSLLNSGSAFLRLLHLVLEAERVAKRSCIIARLAAVTLCIP